MKGIDEQTLKAQGLSVRARRVLLNPKNVWNIPADGASGVWFSPIERLIGAGKRTASEIDEWISENNGRHATEAEHQGRDRQRQSQRYQEHLAKIRDQAIATLENMGYRVTIEEAFKEGKAC